MPKLWPLAMTKPNTKGVYSRSKIRQPETVSAKEFQDRFKGHSKQINVGDPDGKYETKTAYGYGLDCWYEVE